MLNKVRLILKDLNKSKKKKCFFLGNTAKKESSNFYISEPRNNSEFIYSSIIIYNNSYAKKICRLIDGKVDYVFVDTEKKIISKTNKNLVNIEKCAKENIIKSKIYTYKANDLTVQAADTFINNFYLNDVRGIGGKKVLIIGAGNIGFKLGLKLTENGAEVFLNRKNKKKLNKITEAINIIKPIGTSSLAKKIINFRKILNKIDIFIGATNGFPVIKNNDVLKFKKDLFILDIGKGIFFKDALKLATSKKQVIYRLDATPAYNSYLENILSTEKMNIRNKYNVIKKENFMIATKGIITEENTLIVDNLYKPKKLYGVSDGFGSFKKMNSKKLTQIENIITKK